MSMLFNKVASWSKTKKPKATYARYSPGSNSNNCLKLAVLGQKSVRKKRYGSNETTQWTERAIHCEHNIDEAKLKSPTLEESLEIETAATGAFGLHYSRYLNPLSTCAFATEHASVTE